MDTIVEDASAESLAEKSARDGDSPDQVEAELQIPDRFVICDEGSANWLINKVVEARARAARAADWSETIKRRSAADEARLLFLFEGQLRAWLEAQLRSGGGRRKSISVPAGSAGFRAVGPMLVIDDERLVLAWARTACPHVVVVSERVSKTALDQHVKATGELPERGVHVEAPREKFFIK